MAQRQIVADQDWETKHSLNNAVLYKPTQQFHSVSFSVGKKHALLILQMGFTL